MPRKFQIPEARIEKAKRRLGTRNPSCVACGERDPRCMELHHVAGRKHHDDTAIVCKNCHRKLSDQQLDHPSDEAGRNPLLATIGHYLMGLADLFRLLAESLIEFGKWLIDQAQLSPATSKAGVS